MLRTTCKVLNFSKFKKREEYVKEKNYEKTEAQIHLIREFDHLKSTIEKHNKDYENLNSQIEKFWKNEIQYSEEEENENSASNKQGGFFSFLNFFSSKEKKEKENIALVNPIDNKEIRIRTMKEFQFYEKKLLTKFSHLSEIKGLYIFGSPGCGKTFLMDMFFEEIMIPRKKRTHFNEFMLEVHDNLHKLRSKLTYKNTDMDPLYILATEMSKDYNLICFDEFQVTDIADAVILKRLFEVLYKNYVIVVATSNRHPDNLYLNGLQRNLFLPFIHELKMRNKILNISAKDFRIRHDVIGEKFLFPINIECEEKFDKMFFELTNFKKSYEKTIDVMQGRKFICNKYYKGVGMFEFEELCDRPVGNADYIAIAQNCATVLLKNIPNFTVNNRNVMRRFINLIDELYNHNVKLYCLAASAIDDLFIKEKGTEEHYDEVFAFDRAVSRLKEMQSQYYFQKPHKFYVDGEAMEEVDEKIEETQENDNNININITK